uniref:2,4-dienoyl-CoA reductase [(3E)-enoyl-CoA-producing] n=1 Tax=Euplotes crassus TaxID=5936 RepID=A0A7S3KD19_EUPCR
MLQDIAKIFLLHSAKGVVLVARKKEKLQKVVDQLTPFAAKGSECIGLTADVRDTESVHEAVSQTLEKFGTIDILVNGAAGNFLCPADMLSLKGFKTVLDIDSGGTFNVSKEVFSQAFKQQRSGVIINITANLHYGGTPMMIHAGSAKAAVDATTKHLAVEWGPYGVRVMGLCPGFIDGTEGMARLSDMDSIGDKKKAAQSREKGVKTDDAMTDLVPLGRLGSGEDIAKGALYLASDASSYLTGSILMVDGGATLTCPNFVMHSPKFVEMYAAPRKAKI